METESDTADGPFPEPGEASWEPGEGLPEPEEAFPEPGGPRAATGEPRVDAALARLDELAARPVTAPASSWTALCHACLTVRGIA